MKNTNTPDESQHENLPAVSPQQITPTAKPVVSMGDRGVSFSSMDDLARFSVMVTRSGLAPKGYTSPEAVAIAVQAGAEIGLGPMTALQSIAVVNGRPTLWGDAALGLASAHPQFSDIEEVFDTATNTATCTIKRKERSPVQRTFSESDAKKAGLWSKSGPWQQYPQRMLQLRARAFALRDSFPDVLKGIGIREEVADYQPLKKANERPAATGLILPATATTQK